MVEYLVGVDGGGSGTRAVVGRIEGPVLGRGSAGPSALGQGVPQAWRNVELAVRQAFTASGIAWPGWRHCAMAAGLSGAGHPPWRERFVLCAPALAHLALETDSFVMLLGAHHGRPGLIVVAGSGSVAEVLERDGTRRTIGGWGFPWGDEGSGAWLGLQAVRHAQAALDGRAPPGELARRVWTMCGSDRASLQAWCDGAGQYEFAQLAPWVFDLEPADGVAAVLLRDAVGSLEALADAADPGGELPLAVSGSVGRRLASRLAPALRRRMAEPAHDAATGAWRWAQAQWLGVPEVAH